MLGLALPWFWRAQSLRVQIDAFEVRGFDGGEVQPGPPRRSGESFVIRTQMDRDAYPIVLVVSSTSDTQLLYPPDQLLAVRGGEMVQIPLDGSGVAWFLDDDAPRHTFVMAATRDGGVDLEDLLDRAQGREESTYEEDVRRAEKVLSDRVGPARRVSLDLSS